MGKGRDKRRRVRKNRESTKTQQRLLAILCTRTHKWTPLRALAHGVGIKESTAEFLLGTLVRHGDIAHESASPWEGDWKYRVLPQRWPTDAQLRELIVAKVAEMGMTEVPVFPLAREISRRLIGYEAPYAITRVVSDMVHERELIRKIVRSQTYGELDSDFISVPVNNWLKRTAKEQARAGMV